MAHDLCEISEGRIIPRQDTESRDVRHGGFIFLDRELVFQDHFNHSVIDLVFPLRVGIQ